MFDREESLEAKRPAEVEPQAFPHFAEETSADVVNARMGANVDGRTAEVLACLVKHLHLFAKEIQLTQAEWEYGIDFLTKTGQLCSKERQEFILLSDTLGLSMLVDAINNRRPAQATENTVFGPFHVEGAPVKAMGEHISLDGKGESCRYEGRVVDLQGQPVPGAVIDVWSDNADGFYDVQQPQQQPQWNNRGVFITADDGRYSFIGIKPVPYPIPDDGPVGKMLRQLGRHPYRPAHLHFRIVAPGYQKLVTHIFDGDDPYIGSDTVFGVKSSLVADFQRVADGETLWSSVFDFVLVPTGQ